MARHSRKTRRLGVAAGGLLGVALAPAAFAFADDLYGNYDFKPTSPFEVEDGGTRNFLVEVPPAAQGSVQGTEDFSVTDPNGSGTFVGDVTNTTDIFGNTNQEILVTDPTGSGAPPDGSLFDTYTYTSGIKVIYTDIPGTGGHDTVTYTWDTPFGNFNIPTSYDALALTKPVDFTLGNETFTPTGTETIDGVNGIPPADYDLLGTQTFDVTGGGTVTADIANSSDIAGNTTQDMLITQSSDPNLPVGSVVDYFYSGSNSSSYNVYTDIPTANGDKITDTIHSTFGTFNVPTTFDAAKGLADVLNGGSLGQEISVPGGFDITPTGPGTIVGIDGIQPEDIDVQGTQQFDWVDGSQTGTFDANVAQSAIIFGNTTQDQYVVTDSTGGAPPDGSVFEVYNYGHGYETVYSDIVNGNGPGHNLITDTIVTPFGHFNIPDSYDAAAVYAADTSQNFPDAASHAGIFADLLNSLDPSAAASSIDPAAGVDAASMIDPMPHVDALVNLLAGLF